ncbi:protein of unknown function (Integrase-like, catalytic core 244-428) [Magnetospirillum sp. XM-1]|uniref:tyrosine-type recombinase/integrase n=1 Tax=Magnetospirillum sp. XM-1 TaxID=1663591 RepID=UPI00073DDF11|nr:tyrosine-type recombinase/integrase [Magnetospirillum sp. XM-1]CUW39873.1 protein of unknown function (Integrase-like, catalytic core 244-428) [Magnetospirillum sp. XM-1]
MRHTKNAEKSTDTVQHRDPIPLNFTPVSEGTQQLYWRGDRWYCLFRRPGERVPVRLTTGTADEAEARRKAQAEFIKLQTRISSGKPRKDVTFRIVANKLAEELEAELKARKKYGERAPNGDRLRHPQTLGKKINHIRSYLIPLFADKAIKDISDDDIRKAKTHFATYWTEGPGKNISKLSFVKNGRIQETTRRKLGVSNRNTINQYAMTINEVLRFSKTHFGTEHRLTKTVYTDRLDSPRSSITAEQFKAICDLQQKRINAEKREYHKWRLRRVICAFEFVLYSGLRVAEIHSLKWGDLAVIPVQLGKTLHISNVRSKLKPVRSVVCRSEIMHTYNEMNEHRKTDDPLEYVFSNEFNPLKPCHINDGVQVLLQKAGLWSDGRGGYRTLGSMRHSYCQWMIHNMNPFNLYKLAANMGTSEIQIRKHYASDINLRENLEALAGTIDVGLADVFKNAKRKENREAINPFISDAREMIRIWEEVGENWRAMDDDWVGNEIRNFHGEYVYNGVELKAFIATIRCMVDVDAPPHDMPS